MEYATVEPNADSIGHIAALVIPGELTDFCLVAISIAGVIAESLYFGRFEAGKDPKAAFEHGHTSTSGYQNDLAVLRKLKDICPDVNVLPNIAGFALQSLANNWKDVLLLVGELKKSRTLTGADIAGLLPSLR